MKQILHVSAFSARSLMCKPIVTVRLRVIRSVVVAGMIFAIAHPVLGALGTPPLTITAQNRTVGLSDELKLRIPFAQAADATHKIDQLVLFLNDRKLKSLHPIGINPAENTVTFKLVREKDDRTTWNSLLSRPDRDYTKQWSVSIGYDDIGPISTAEPVGFMILRAKQVNWYWIGIFIFGIVSLWTAFYTGLLRDQKGYYSLGRSQMLFWFWLVVAGFAFIWMVTADRKIEIPNSVLGLIGISAATGLAAGLIDDDKAKKGPAPPPKPPTVKPTLAGSVREFASDILRSDGQIDLHRFQIVVWTTFLGVMFVHAVYTDLAMPDFDNSLLTLMGISSGTYIGFKFPEKV